MVHILQHWTGLLHEAGNEPGAQAGEVVVELVSPVAGEPSYQLPSADLQLAVEAGSFIGAQAVLPDGRHIFIPAANIAGVIDAPSRSQRKKSGS